MSDKPSNKVGGVGDVKAADDDIREIVTKIKPELEKRMGKEIATIEPVNYRMQVVAGRNYFVKVRLTHPDDTTSMAHLRIFQGFNKEIELTNHQADKGVNDEISYF